MASVGAIDGAAVAALESRQVTPIAQLSPELPDQDSRSVRGEVTITWPYNRVTHTLAFLLAEPDVRLRRTKGQVRVQLHGLSAKAVADCGLGACDEVLLSLEGVEWTKDESPGSIPGARVDWQLQFNKKLVLQAKLNGADEPKHISIDSEETELPDELPEPSTIQQLEQTVVEPEPTIIEQLSAIRKVPDIASNEYPSPAFIKRARLSYGSLFEDGLDIFEEDGGVQGKGRKRSRFTPKTKTWRYSSKSPTPEPDYAPEEDQVSTPQPPKNDAMEEDTLTETAGPKPKMTDGTSQTIESEMTPIPPISEQIPAEKTEAVSHPATWEKVQAKNQEKSNQETEVAQAASHIHGMANGTMNQPYPYQHTDHQAQATSNSLFGSSKPAVSRLSMFGTPASVPVESEYGIANQVRFGFSHTPQVPQPGVAEPQMQAASESGPYPDSYLDHSVPAKYEGMESYMNIAQNNPELQHGPDYNIIPVPAGIESFERGQWEMATQAPHYNPVEGGHFGPDALNEGTPAIIEDPSLHADPTRPDQVPKGFSSYGRASEGPAGFEEPEEPEQEAEGSESDELVENEEADDADEAGIGGDNEVQYDEYGEGEEGDYDQREYLEPESDDEGLNQDEEEVELEVAERYGEGDVYDEDDEDEEMGDYAEDWDEEGKQYEDEDDYESEDKDLGQSPPRRAPAAAVPADPVVISLLSDSEDEDEAPPPPRPAAPTSRPTMTRQLSIRHSSPPARAQMSASPQKQEKSPVVEKDQPAEKEEPKVKQDNAMEEPIEDQSKPSVERLNESSPADEKDRDLQPKEEAKLIEPAMTIVHTEPVAGADTEEAPISSVVEVKDLTSETGAKDTEPSKTSDTKPEEQPGEDTLLKAEDDQLEERQEDAKSEAEANDETFEGFSSDAEIVEKIEDDSESEEDDEMLDEDQEEDNEMLDEDEEEEEEHDGNDDQVVDLLDTTSEEEDEEEDEENHEKEHSDFEPVESESEEEMHPEIHEDYKVMVDEEATKEVKKTNDKELVVEIEQKKADVDQGVEKMVEEAKAGNNGNFDDKTVATEASTKAEEVKETDAKASDFKDAKLDVQRVKAEQDDVKETAETAAAPKKDEAQIEQGQVQGSPSPVILEETVEKTVTVEEEQQLETDKAITSSESEPTTAITLAAPSNEGQIEPDTAEEVVDEMDAVQHQLFEDMARASREASMMEVSDAEHVSVMSQDTPRPVQPDSDEEMGEGDDEDVDMEDAATPRPEFPAEEGQVSQAVEVEMTSETVEVNSDSMSVTHEESVEIEITEAPHVHDSAMEDAEMVVEEETQVTVETEVTVTEAPAPQQSQGSPSATVDVIDHAPQQAVLPSSPPPTQPFASQVAEDEIMLVGSSSPAKEAVREKSLPTPNQSGLLGQEVAESLQPEDARATADTVVEESTEVVIEESETTTTEPQVATTEEGVETQDEVSLIVVEEESEKQAQDVNSDQTDEDKEVTSTIEPIDDETLKQKEESSQTTATPAQSQFLDEKDADLSDNLTRQTKKTPAKRGRKSQQPALEPLRSSARLTRARSGSVSKSFTTAEDNDETKAAALASPSKRSFASSFNSSVPPSEDNATPQPTTSLPDEDHTTANSNDPATLKLSLSRLLRSQSQFTNCLTLKSIRNHLGQNVDIVAIVSSQPTNPVRAKGGPREYMMSFNVTDPSTAPAHVVEVQMYRPHKESLPIVKPGDAILLKQVEIRSFSAGKGFGLRTGEQSAWAVFEVTAEEEQDAENGDAAATTNQAPPQIKGSPVENWEEFAGYMVMLKKWYRLLMKDEAAKGKLKKAVKKFEK
ncbi:hypothetical protein B0T20DRAFT_430101 [Sordaria brevicollis]|uniref:Telomeric single stranded DNA binding POT1/Cdc13 domain-containing protein n=1 Tax=Sordaria brevicollis TaxID=83679 RepID=A0AAE0PPF4_SORBR|nr:hypothetical protein B0T20DRAFT_430101 [Sordaria brevicollis]